MTIIRDWLDIDEPAKDRAERQAVEQRRRLVRIDVDLEIRARRVQVFPHPSRRASDR